MAPRTIQTQNGPETSYPHPKGALITAAVGVKPRLRWLPASPRYCYTPGAVNNGVRWWINLPHEIHGQTLDPYWLPLFGHIMVQVDSLSRSRFADNLIRSRKIKDLLASWGYDVA